MAYDLAAIRKAKQTYKPATNTAMGGVMMPIQAISAATRTTPSKATPVATSAAQQMVTNTAPRTEQTLNTIQQKVNTPFAFNAETDQGYQSALRAAQQNLQVSQKNTNAQLRASGQGKSSYSETVQNQLANQSNENIANNILPQYVQQAYGQYQDSINNQSNLYGLQYQQDVTTPMNEAQLTGVYQNEAVKAALATINDSKTKYEDPSATAAERMMYRQAADKARLILDQNGVDSSKYGANVNSKDINFANAGVRTLEGANSDLRREEFDYNKGVTNAQLSGIMPDGTRTTAEQQRNIGNLWTAADQTGYIPDELATMYNLPKGMQTLQAKNIIGQLAISQQNTNISQQNANTSRNSANNSASNANHSKLMDVWQATGKAPAGLESLGVTKGQQYTTAAANTAATKAETPERYEDYQSTISKVVDNNEDNPKVAQDYIKSLPLTTYEKYRAWIASGYEWPSNVEVPTPGE